MVNSFVSHEQGENGSMEWARLSYKILILSDKMSKSQSILRTYRTHAAIKIPYGVKLWPGVFAFGSRPCINLVPPVSRHGTSRIECQ